MASLVHNIRYTPSKANPNMRMIPAIKSEGMEYFKYALVYVDDVLVISFVPMKTTEGIKCVSRIKGDKTEPPKMYLGASLEHIKTKG